MTNSVQNKQMLWKPTTDGEQVFLSLHRYFGSQLEFSSQRAVDLDLLSAPHLFIEFARLSATLELFLRVIRTSARIYREFPALSATQFTKTLHQHERLPPVLLPDRVFSEAVKGAARIRTEMLRSGAAEKEVSRVERSQCYLCGIRLTTTTNHHSQRTIDHLWPLSLGGESIADNLLPSCADCNHKKNHTITWAWGPVQSTFHKLVADERPPADLCFSLGISRLMLEANRGRKRGYCPLTLKEAAKNIWPAVPDRQVSSDNHLVYFEIAGKMGAIP